MSKLPNSWTYLVVGERVYIIDEENDKLFLVDGSHLIEVGSEVEL